MLRRTLGGDFYRGEDDDSSMLRRRRTLKMMTSSDDDDEENDSISSSTFWMKDAMNLSPEDTTTATDDFSVPSILEPGLAGFSVHPQLGFCAILASSFNNNDTKHQSFTYVVLSPQDTDRVQSPEALTMVQLAGGLDLGTAILPPDLVPRLVHEAFVMEQEEEEEEKSESDGSSSSVPSIDDLRPRVSLSSVLVEPNPDWCWKNDSSNASNNHHPDGSNSKNDQKKRNAERSAAIAKSAPQVLQAVQKLPGITDSCTLEDIINGMEEHGSPNDGSLSRDGFSQLLQTLRSKQDKVEEPRVSMKLQVSILSGDSISVKSISCSPLQGIGMSLRYKVPLELSEECWKNTNTNTSTDNNDEETKNCYCWNVVPHLQNMFPAFRPIQELQEDARIMDGFIPSMYQKAIQNDDKV